LPLKAGIAGQSGRLRGVRVDIPKAPLATMQTFTLIIPSGASGPFWTLPDWFGASENFFRRTMESGSTIGLSWLLDAQGARARLCAMANLSFGALDGRNRGSAFAFLDRLVQHHIERQPACNPGKSNKSTDVQEEIR
jgi:hypothetical protein